MKEVMVRVGGAINHSLYLRNGVLYVRKSFSGLPELKRRLDTNDLKKARELRDEAIAAHTGKKPKQYGAKLVGDDFPEWLERRPKWRATTHDSAKNQWENHLKEYFGRMLLSEINSAEWELYIAWKRAQVVKREYKRKNKPSIIKFVSLAKRKFFNDRKYLSMYLIDKHRAGELAILPKLIDPDTTDQDGDDFEEDSASKKAGKVYSADEISRLISKAGPTLKLQILMGLTMAMRPGEVLSLEWWQINWERETIFIPKPKTKIKKARTFSISANCLPLLKERFAANGHKGSWVFPSPRNPSVGVGRQGNKKSWATCKREAGVVGRLHDLRHTFLTMACKKAGANHTLICEYAGLSMKELQKTYLHLKPEDTREVASLVSFEL